MEWEVVTLLQAKKANVEVMGSEERTSSQEGERRRRGMNFDLYYYERNDTGYSLRITPLGLLLVLIALIVGFAILFSFAPSRKKPNIKITVPPTPTGSLIPSTIKPAPSSPPQLRKRSGIAANGSPSTPQASKNANDH